VKGAAADEPKDVVIDWSREHQFQQYHTKDSFGRTITFYLTGPVPGKGDVPLVLLVSGSEPSSVFTKDEQKHFCGFNYDVYLQPLKDRARLMLVEKPGVRLFDRGDNIANWSQEFLQEHTLERITEAHNAAIKAAQALEGISKTKLLVIGHSEGAQVATHLALVNPGVTHLVRLAGNGPTQLFDLILSAQTQAGQSRKSAHGGPAITSTMATEDMIGRWKDIVANKDSTTKFLSGHPYKRWYSFCSNSPLDDLLHCSTKLYVVHGTEDESTSIIGFDLLQAELLAHNRPFTAERLEGVDHSLYLMRDKKRVAFKQPEVVQRILDWYFAD
jgi:pimeloyl-ACP methyl ester carboxylesterase